MTEQIYSGTIASAKSRSKWNLGQIIKYQVNVSTPIGLICKTFTFSQFPSAEAAYSAAEKFRQETSDAHGLTVSRPTMVGFWDDIKTCTFNYGGEEFAQYVGGFMDGDGCIHATADRKIVVSISQAQQSSIPVILTFLQNHYGEGVLLHVPAKLKNHRDMHVLRFYGQNALGILQDIADYGIVKRDQAASAIKFLRKDIKFEEVHSLLSSAKNLADYQSVSILTERLTPAYIAGLFDAEGCVGVKGQTSIVVQLSQKQSPVLLEEITKLHGGSVIADERMLSGGENAIRFLELIKPFCVHKLPQILCAMKIQEFSKLHFRKRTPEDKKHASDLKAYVKAQKHI